MDGFNTAAYRRRELVASWMYYLLSAAYDGQRETPGVSGVGSILMDRYVHPVTAEFHRVGNFPSLPCYSATWLLCYKCICAAYYCFMLFCAVLFCYSPRRLRAYLNFLPVTPPPPPPPPPRFASLSVFRVDATDERSVRIIRGSGIYFFTNIYEIYVICKEKSWSCKSRIVWLSFESISS